MAAAGIDEQTIMSISGHRSLAGVRAYRELTDEDKRNAAVTYQIPAEPKAKRLKTEGSTEKEADSEPCSEDERQNEKAWRAIWDDLATVPHHYWQECERDTRKREREEASGS